MQPVKVRVPKVSVCTAVASRRPPHGVPLEARGQVSPDSDAGGFAHPSGVDVDPSFNLTVYSLSLARHMWGTFMAMIGRGAAEGEGKERIRGRI